MFLLQLLLLFLLMVLLWLLLLLLQLQLLLLVLILVLVVLAAAVICGSACGCCHRILCSNCWDGFLNPSLCCSLAVQFMGKHCHQLEQ